RPALAQRRRDRLSPGPLRQEPPVRVRPRGPEADTPTLVAARAPAQPRQDRREASVRAARPLLAAATAWSARRKRCRPCPLQAAAPRRPGPRPRARSHGPGLARPLPRAPEADEP